VNIPFYIHIMDISYHVNGVLYIDKNIGVGYRLKLWLLR